MGLSTSVPVWTRANVSQGSHSALSNLGLHIYLWKKGAADTQLEKGLGTVAARNHLFSGVFL